MIHGALGLLVATSTNTALQAQTNSAAATLPPPPSSFDAFANGVKKPVDWFNWGGDLRVRNESYDNIVSLTSSDRLHDQDVIRYRGRLWASLLPVGGLSLNARLSAEPRQWMNPSFVGAYRGETGMEWRYGIVDVLNLKWTNAFNLPLTITAGRQDLAFGDYWNWWLVADGTPGDGSWSFFLDGVRLTYDLPELKTKVDLAYIYQNARPDEWVPTIGRSTDAYLTEQNEQGIILYASNKQLERTQLDGYFIYKRDDRELAQGDNADIFTLGGRIVGTPAEHWLYSVEGAYQFGRKQDPTLRDGAGGNLWRELDAFGSNARLSYLFRDPWQNQAHLVFEFLSGDHPGSKDDEMFDILWGRWPRFSEGYIYSYIYETGGRVAQINNLERLGAGWSLCPRKDLNVSAYYNAWFAPEQTATRARNPGLFGGGDFRGHYVQTVIKQQFSKHVAGHLWGEFIWAGDYYQDRSFMDFLRAEILLTF
ncbi:MAG: hypothetical protein U1G07_14710 [Verrucomicrobiota bacterium]